MARTLGDTTRSPRETRQDTLEPLAVLPVFMKLAGKRVLVAGGSAGAAWKARLLASTGADVTVCAADISDDMHEAATLCPLTLIARDWTAADFDGAAFAIIASGCWGEAAAFAAIGRAKGVIVNAVDRAELCDVQFGSIVNRSPLVIGVSTDGAAPVFGQQVRSAIETLLPAGFARWAAAAKRIRARITAAFDGPAARRRFWERFSDRAFTTPDVSPDDALIDRLAEGTEAPVGSVTLVGAGPGDPELLTLAALRALRTADVVLYDDLVAREILDFARREAKTMLVGKTGHGPSCKQDDINALMVALALQGKRVVRLKGGDPGVFGRGTEEIEAARAAGLPVAIVPGVTTAQGAAARLGVSLTHRAVARRLQYVTGHDRNGALPDNLDVKALADPTATTVVYMPKKTWPALAAKVVAAGLGAETPAVAVFDATRPTESVIAATLGTLPDALGRDPRSGPCVVLYGEALAGVASRSAALNEVPPAETLTPPSAEPLPTAPQRQRQIA